MNKKKDETTKQIIQLIVAVCVIVIGFGVVKVIGINEDYKHIFLTNTSLEDKRLRRFPAVLIGRLATNKAFAGKGFGSAVMYFIKTWFRFNNKTGCRFLIVDAYNNEATLHYYLKNGFKFLVDDERLEAKYMEIGIGRLPLHTRLMYYDLLEVTYPQ